MTVLLVHYHLRAGGVTRVVQAQVNALRELGHQVIIASSGPIDGWDFPTLVIPELDYRPSGSVPIDPLIAASADLWIIHNPTLGLNAGYPGMIEAATERGLPLILQIHDFVEDGRPANYQLVRGNEHLYPHGPHIHYATINRRDQGILIGAGLPAERCHYLPNAIIPPRLEKTDPGEGLVFYPVRGIRRKNLGELCLLAAHAPPDTSFAIALRSGSEEPPYLHDDWVRFADRLALPVSFDVVGQDPDSFPRWLERSSHLVTTSISEGFGLTFLDPAFLGKPLLGRDLPEITCDFSPAGRFYQSIPIPLSALPGLAAVHRRQLTAAMTAYGKEIDDRFLDEAWEAFAEGGEVDFGNLPESYQRQVIETLRLPWLSEWLREALARPAKTIDTSPWSLPRYAARMAELIAAPARSGPVEWLVPQKILDRFLEPSRFHFLRSPLANEAEAVRTCSQ